MLENLASLLVRPNLREGDTPSLILAFAFGFLTLLFFFLLEVFLDLFDASVFLDQFECSLWTNALYGLHVVASEEDAQVDELIHAQTKPFKCL